MASKHGTPSDFWLSHILILFCPACNIYIYVSVYEYSICVFMMINKKRNDAGNEKEQKKKKDTERKNIYE